MKYSFIVPILFLLFTMEVHAYRGYEVEKVQPLKTPLSGMPGFFNASMASAKTSIFELPTFSFDYGVTDDFTLGTNFLPAFGLIAGYPSGSVKAKYRFISQKNYASTITGYATGLWATEPSQTNSFRLLILTNNHTFYSSRYHAFSLQFNAINARVSTEKNSAESSNSATIIAPGLGYEYFFNDWFGYEAQFMLPVTTQFQLETPFQATTAHQKQMYFPSRLNLQIKSSQTTAWSVGMIGLLARSPGKHVIFPMVTWTKVFN
jgi:hypothetical protein